jgi:hypothetical protein
MQVQSSSSIQARPGPTKGQSIFVSALAAWLLLSTSTITILTWPNPRVRATVGMVWGLILLWIGLSGMVMFVWREQIRAAVVKVRLGWRKRFVLFATALALFEEGITTTMTNLAPFFGVEAGQAYITASTNYFDVVGLHSVVVFVPLLSDGPSSSLVTISARLQCSSCLASPAHWRNRPSASSTCWSSDCGSSFTGS